MNNKETFDTKNQNENKFETQMLNNRDQKEPSINNILLNQSSSLFSRFDSDKDSDINHHLIKSQGGTEKLRTIIELEQEKKITETLGLKEKNSEDENISAPDDNINNNVEIHFPVPVPNLTKTFKQQVVRPSIKLEPGLERDTIVIDKGERSEKTITSIRKVTMSSIKDEYKRKPTIKLETNDNVIVQEKLKKPLFPADPSSLIKYSSKQNQIQINLNK